MTQKALDDHMLYHSGEQEIYVCDYFGKEYTLKTALQRHMKDKHPDEEVEEEEEEPEEIQ